MKWDRLLNVEYFREKNIENQLDELKKDSSKIIFSSAFRRLQNKTQIYPLESNDFVRTRLTHSIEVSTIAQIIGNKIEKRLIEIDELPKEKKGMIENILKAASLVHDIGNPPFGHYGEFIIHDFYTKYFAEKFKNNIDFYGYPWSLEEIYDFEKFEGNAQAFRLLKKLQYLRDENGLNLSFQTLATIIKYPRSSTEGCKKNKDTSYKKFGYFSSEKKSFEKIFDTLGIKNKDGEMVRYPLVYLLEAADDIAYTIADIEDGCKKGVLGLDIIKNKLIKYCDLKDQKEREILESLDVIEVDLDYPKPFEIAIQVTRKKLQDFMMDSVVDTFIDYYDGIMKGDYKGELLKDSKASWVEYAFRELLEILINEKEVIKLEVAGDRIIRVLLKEFTDAVASPNRDIMGTKEQKLFRLMSSNYRFLMKKYPDTKNKLYNELHLVTDFICGMTDSYALDLYQAIMAIKY
ncbi:MAG TPA: deoxyguanosinetriphosphate triphosphohydrolase [Fusobacteriaceae bacterium]|nr:deoxyguanosinetriphosphate triphosphohydrolase [Fusobacteriaceae bacterium]